VLDCLIRAPKKVCGELLTSAKPSHKLNHMVKYLPPPLDRLFFALSDPTRRAIVARLAQGEITIAALAAPFAMSLVAVSKHIRVLEQAGLLTRTKLGREFHLRLVPEPLRAAADWIDQFEQFWTQHLDHVKARAEQKARERARLKSKNP
jgi:DNA-binding transcriptional ArsR family regulator